MSTSLPKEVVLAKNIYIIKVLIIFMDIDKVLTSKLSGYILMLSLLWETEFWLLSYISSFSQ